MSALGFMGWQGPDWQGSPTCAGVWVFRGPHGKGAINVGWHNKGKPYINTPNEEGRPMKLTDLLFVDAQWCLISRSGYLKEFNRRVITPPSVDELRQHEIMTQEIRHVLESEMPAPNTFY
jgi:hypothetical protein